MTESKIANLHPAWSAIPLGTAGVAVVSLFDPIPNLDFDDLVGFTLAVIALLLLLGIGFLNLIRIFKYKAEFKEDLKHPMFGAMIGTLPASSLVVGLALAQLGKTFLIFEEILGFVAFGLMLLGVVGALLVGVLFFSGVVKNQELPAGMISGTWFIPIVVFVLVPSVVIRISELTGVFNGGLTYLLTFGALGAGLLLFIFLGAVVAWRLIATPPPPAQMSPTWIIWLAPAGAGGLGVLASMRMLQVFSDQNLNLVVEIMGIFGASLLWGFGIWWLIFSLAQIIPQRKVLHFHLGSWGFSFPLAALLALTLELSRVWDTLAVTYLGIVGWVAVLAVWLWLIFRTLQKTVTGEVFNRS
ncbi:MAG: hypothetical protein ACO3T8_02310 [Candidatus Nanopelagicales bacterium]